MLLKISHTCSEPIDHQDPSQTTFNQSYEMQTAL